jgi:D-3-phosphoglycerate dehydrogenase / 2-oxoglutarate reductase
MIKVVFSDYYYPNIDEEIQILKGFDTEVEILDLTKIIPGGIKDPQKLLPYVKDADALIVQFAKINKELINSLDRCKVIARYAIGVDTIDIKAATEKKIYVANVPDYCIDEVADTAIAHILNAMRKISLSRDMVLSGKFSMDAILPMKRIKDTNLGLIGFGNIARDVARKMKPFIKSIFVYDPYFSDELDYHDFHFGSLADVLGQSDVISIHVPLNESTSKMFSRENFDLMKKDVILINTSRGGVIDESALLDALESGKVGFCGLDVLTTEDFDSSPLTRHPKVCVSPHIGWNSEGAMKELQRKTALNVVATFNTGKPTYYVNAGI